MSEPRTGALVVGVIGTGGIAGAHGPGWVEAGVDLHAYSLEGAPAFGERFGATVHESLDSLLAAVDVVDICTPTPVHAEIAHRALDAGCHVICEKPLTRTLADAEALLEHAERAGKLLFPAHVVRYFPQYAAAKAAIDAGAIGTPAVLRYERTGQFPRMPWFADQESSGGIVMDQMIHDIDQAIWVAGPVASVYAREHVAADNGEVRTAHVVLTHGSGAISHCRGFWGPAGTEFRYGFSLAGDRGRLDYDSADDSSVRFDAVASSGAGGDGDALLPDISGMRSPYAEEILDAVAALSTGTTPRVAAADGLAAVRASLAALESLATGRSIPC
ncbi:Gfo/Idh/MocA family protein [Brachybacterium hainanense]|uniref:Gfo/Idh/MocA family protein n=1 Tax=Brachybacterium hainanense TaxID=1541174 RepID=A0ABV6R5W6_9MICO